MINLKNYFVEPTTFYDQSLKNEWSFFGPGDLRETNPIHGDPRKTTHFDDLSFFSEVNI